MDVTIAGVLAEIGAEGWVHAIDLDAVRDGTAAEIDHQADVPVVSASVFKLPLLVELFRQVSAGTLAGTQRVRIGADERRTLGGTGTAVFRDDIDVSLRDLALLMMSVSDNRATDIIGDLVGLDAVNALMVSLGLPGTVLPGDCQYLFDTIAEDLGDIDGDTIDPTSPDDPRLHVRAADPLQTNRTTPREATTLLGLLWRDEELPAEACAAVREILGHQVWPHRLTAGFEDGITVSGKTGTLGPVRNEVGVVEYPDGGRYAVAVFLRASTAAGRHPAADAAIGRIGRIAVDTLRA